MVGRSGREEEGLRETGREGVSRYATMRESGEEC